jgi:thymidylate synthase (FAD)
MKQVLDHGYVKLIDKWGSDESIIEAARMSTNKGFLGWGPKEDGTPGDEKLLGFLYKNQHMTPFEMGGAVIEVQAPILVFREWHRHRTQSYNEMSARYTPLPDVNYVPSLERLMMNSNGANKQAGTVAGAEALTEENALAFQANLRAIYARAEEEYQWALKAGVPKELARAHLPVGRYSRMRAQANLRNWLAFLTLRIAPNAQWEIRQYAQAVSEIIEELFPRTHELFLQGLK